MKNKYLEPFDSQFKKNIRQLVGKPLGIFYSPYLEITQEGVFSRQFSFNVDNVWYNIFQEEKLSPNDNDYYKLILETSNAPLPTIKYDVKSNNFKGYVSSVNFFRNEIVQKVQLFEKREIWDNEEFVYAYAIIFHFSNNQLMVRLEESAVENVVLHINNFIPSKILDKLIEV